MSDFVTRYDSFEDPISKSEYLDAIGKTRAEIAYARYMRDVATKAAAKSKETPATTEPPAHLPGHSSRSTRRSATTRPRNRNAPARKPRRQSLRTRIVIIVIKLD